MKTRNFRSLLEAKWDEGKMLCVGLDPDLEKLPEQFKGAAIKEAISGFNRVIVDATSDIVCAYKPNSAFYERYGDVGWAALKETIEYVHEKASHIPIIFDAKRADIGNTNNGYVSSAFKYVLADAITVHPYMGGESLKEFLACKDKGIFVMCRNSNPGAGEFQDLEINGEPLYLHLAKAFRDNWNYNGNCGLVVGATYPDDVARVRAVAPDVPFLIPGTGAQGGDLETSVRNGKDSNGRGFILSTSRAVIYASKGADFAEAARHSAQTFDSAIREAVVR